MRFCITTLVLFIVLSTVTFADTLRRAAFDVGSGTTKMVVADVDLEKGTFTVVADADIKVSYKDDLANKENQGRFSKDIRTQGFEALKKLKAEAIELGAKQFFGVCSQAFRESKNGESFIKEMNQKGLGISLQIIDQKTEAMLGYHAAIIGEKDIDKIATWDVGGGSMQIVFTDTDGNLKYIGKEVGAESFKKMIIQDFQKKDPMKIMSPNPISIEVANKTSQTVEVNLHKEGIDEALKTRMLMPDTQVIGIGGVLYYSVRNQVDTGKTFSQAQVEATMKSRLGMTDKQIGGKFYTTEISNLIMINTYMKTYSVRNIRVKKVNLAHGMIQNSITAGKLVYYDDKGKEWVQKGDFAIPTTIEVVQTPEPPSFWQAHGRTVIFIVVVIMLCFLNLRRR